MSRLYETLRGMELQRERGVVGDGESVQPMDLVTRALAEPSELETAPTLKIVLTPQARLVALTDPCGLGAEKFRALVTRLENQRKQRELRVLQITSALVNEGKSLIAGNLAVTLATHTSSRVLVVEGDLHRPTLSALFGLGPARGIGQWWSGREESQKLSRYVYRLENLSLWFLGAGTALEQPSQILQSARFAEEFVPLTGWFDWVVVDSTPMFPMADANLWSRLVDGTLLVVREGVTPVRALKKGLQSLDNPKLAGIVLNEACDFDETNYADQYYGLSRPGTDVVPPQR